MHRIPHLPTTTDLPPMGRAWIGALQDDLGCRCGQRCRLRHVDVGLCRTEMMGGTLLSPMLAQAL